MNSRAKRVLNLREQRSATGHGDTRGEMGRRPTAYPGPSELERNEASAPRQARQRRIIDAGVVQNQFF